MPPVYLNHVYRVLDKDTFAAVDHSEYLRTEFAQFERRTTKSGDDSWTGLYFYGETTYFEFLAADPARQRPLGQSGVALGVEEAGASAAVGRALEALGAGKVRSLERPRETAGRMVPWFRMTGFEPGDPILVSWVMEYSPSFLKEWHPELRPGLSGISRQAVLERYHAKAALTAPVKDPLLKDVTALRLALPPAQGQAFGRELAALGFRSEPKDGEASWTGPGVRIDVVPAAGGAGIVALEMSLTRKPLETEDRRARQRCPAPDPARRNRVLPLLAPNFPSRFFVLPFDGAGSGRGPRPLEGLHVAIRFAADHGVGRHRPAGRARPSLWPAWAKRRRQDHDRQDPARPDARRPRARRRSWAFPPRTPRAAAASATCRRATGSPATSPPARRSRSSAGCRAWTPAVIAQARARSCSSACGSRTGPTSASRSSPRA